MMNPTIYRIMSVCDKIYITYNFLPSSFLILLLIMMTVVVAVAIAMTDAVAVAYNIKRNYRIINT